MQTAQLSDYNPEYVINITHLVTTLVNEGTAQCSLQKTEDLNGQLLLCMFLANEFQ
jgi:hypothetical protein